MSIENDGGGYIPDSAEVSESTLPAGEQGAEDKGQGRVDIETAWYEANNPAIYDHETVRALDEVIANTIWGLVDANNLRDRTIADIVEASLPAPPEKFGSDTDKNAYPDKIGEIREVHERRLMIFILQQNSEYAAYAAGLESGAIDDNQRKALGVQLAKLTDEYIYATNPPALSPEEMLNIVKLARVSGKEHRLSANEAADALARRRARIKEQLAVLQKTE